MNLNEPVYSVVLSNAGDGLASFASAPRTKGAAVGGAMGGYAYGSPYADSFNRTRAPSPIDLVREALDTAYACLTLNADLVASTRLRLYVKTTKRRAKSRLIERGDTKRISKATRRRIEGITKAANDADDLQEVTSHPALDLLARPNLSEDGVGLSEYVLWEITQRYQEVRGVAYWYVERNGMGGTPSAIWSLPAHLVQEIPDPTNKAVISHYIYTAGSNRTRYEVDEIIPFRFPDLHTGGYMGGFSPLRACYERVILFRKYSALVGAQLTNGGKPSAVWSPTGEGAMVGQDEAKRMREAFRQAFAMGGAGGVMVMNEPGALEILNWAADEVVSPEQFKLARVAVANCFSVPTTKLDRADSTLASAKTGDYAHAKDAGLPRLRRNEAALNQFLVPMFDPDGMLFFAYDEPEGLRDEAAEFEKSKAAAASGAILRNEIREELGLEGVPWGDQPLVSNTMIAVDPVTGVPVPPAVPAKPEPDDNASDTAKSLSVAATALAEAMKGMGKTLREVRRLVKEKNHADIAIPAQPVAPTLPSTPATDAGGAVRDAGEPEPVGDVPSDVSVAAVPAEGDSQAADVDVVAKAASVIGHVDPYTGLAAPLPQGEGIAHVLRRIFAEQCAAVLGGTEKTAPDIATKDENAPPPSNPRITPGFGDDGLPLTFIPLDEWTATMAKEIQPVVEILMKDGAKDLVTRIGASPEVFRVVNRYVPEAAHTLTLKFCQETNATTSLQLDEALTKLREEIAEGLDVGDTRVEMRKRVQEVFDKADKSRAETIARTEASRARHTGEEVAAKESGVVKKKKWLISSDACPICDEIVAAHPDGVGLDENFGETDYGPINAPPAHPNCQCSTTYVLVDREVVEVTATGVE